MILENIKIVLVSPSEPMNIGAVARAMKNNDLCDLAIVAPRTDDWVTARRVAVHAEEILREPKIFNSLSEAISECVWVAGTTSRLLPERRALSPREVATEAFEKTENGKIAIVFGCETNGLPNSSLIECSAISTIPSGQAQPSLNLAQAVMVYGYEIFQMANERVAGHAPKLATAGQIDSIEKAFRELLEISGFADVDRPRHGVRDLVQTLRRAALTSSEARLWFAAIRCAAQAKMD